MTTEVGITGTPVIRLTDGDLTQRGYHFRRREIEAGE